MAGFPVSLMGGLLKRVGGAIQMVGGVLEASAGVAIAGAPEPTMATIAVGGFLFADGIANAGTGAHTLVHGDAPRTVTEQVAYDAMTTAGVPEETADIAAPVLTGLGGAALESKVARTTGTALEAAADATSPATRLSDEAAEVVGDASRAASRVRVAYGSTDLSEEATEYAIREGVGDGTNVAVFEYIDDAGNTQTVTRHSGRGVGHAERLAATELQEMGIPNENVTRIYSDLDFCAAPGGYCGRMITEGSPSGLGPFPNAELSYAFPYGGDPHDPTAAAAGVEMLRQARAAARASRTGSR